MTKLYQILRVKRGTYYWNALFLLSTAYPAFKTETKQEAAAEALGKKAPTNVPTDLGAEYAAFFQEQLELYGQNSKGKKIIDQEKLIEFEDRHPFSRL